MSKDALDPESHVEDRADPPSRRRFRIYAVALAVVAVLAVSEIALRMRANAQREEDIGAPTPQDLEDSVWQASDDSELIYVHRPNATTTWKWTLAETEGKRLTESHGILSPTEVTLAKEAGAFRVAMFGDSVTAGLSVSHRHRFPALLESSLARASALKGRPVEVLNFGVDGYDTVQEARLIELSAERFEPDVVVVVYCMNDVAESVTPLGWFRDPVRPWSVLAALAGLGFQEERVPVAPADGPGKEPEAWAQLYDPDGLGWRRVEQGLDRIAAWTKETGVPVLFVVFPLIDPEDPSSECTEPFRAQVVTAAEQRSLPVLDLTPAFVVFDPARLQVGPLDVYHPNEEGHRIAAKAIHDAVLRLR